MAPVLWLLLGGAAGAYLTSKTAMIAGRGMTIAGAGMAMAAVAAIRKKLSPQARAEFDAAFAGLTPEEVLAVIDNENDPDAMKVGQIAQRHFADRARWVAMLRTLGTHATHGPAPVVHAAASAGYMWPGYGWSGYGYTYGWPRIGYGY